MAVEKASEAGEVMLKSGKVNEETSWKLHQGILDTIWLRQSACLVKTGKLS